MWFSVVWCAVKFFQNKKNLLNTDVFCKYDKRQEMRSHQTELHPARCLKLKAPENYR
jgi:hypothetical protein